MAIVLWNGEAISTAPGEPVARIIVRSRRTLWNLLMSPEVAFGDGYSTGDIEVDGDLTELNIAVVRAKRNAASKGLVRSFLARCLEQPRGNSLNAARKNIHHHYNLGNDFYRLWLDDRMQYTCAYFPRQDASLEEAQLAKMHHVCRKLQLKPGQTVVEAGCGWGGLALHMARHYGVTVRAYNISHEQIAYARARAKTEGLDGRVEYVEDDYRNISGTYDAFASVGMLEHVGTAHYRELGEVIHTCLKEGGRGLIHSIGRNVPAPNNVWIEKRIFPGSYPPNLREMMYIFEPFAFSILDVENLRLHYAKTLQHWLDRFNANEQQIGEMYDEPFVRAWRLYLAGSRAAFLASSLQLFQVVFAYPTDNSVPWTRDHIYRD